MINSGDLTHWVWGSRLCLLCRLDPPYPAISSSFQPADTSGSRMMKQLVVLFGMKTLRGGLLMAWRPFLRRFSLGFGFLKF